MTEDKWSIVYRLKLSDLAAMCIVSAMTGVLLGIGVFAYMQLLVTS